MIELKVDQRSVDNTLGYLDAVGVRILENVHAAMEESMEGLAAETIEQMIGAGIQSRTGQLLENIGNSARVKETAEFIYGSVSARREMKLGGRTFLGFVGTAIDEGFHVREFEGNLYEFTEPDAGTLYARGHAAFDVKPHPFLAQSQQAYETPIMDAIRAAIVEGLTA